jgi:DNA-binding NarL/FixJ family response regulator
VHSLIHPIPESPAVKRRVLIVDDHWFFAACLRTFVDHQSDFVVCDIAPSSADLMERIARLDPDLLLIDLALGGECGLDLGARLRERGVDTPILFVSTLASPAREELEKIGHCAFSPKTLKPVGFLRLLRSTLDACKKTTDKDAVGLTEIKSLV